LVALGMIGSSGLSDQATPFSAKIVSSDARARPRRIAARDLHPLRARLARRVADGGAGRVVRRRERPRSS